MDADDEYQLSVLVCGKPVTTTISKQEIKTIIKEAYREIVKERLKHEAFGISDSQRSRISITGPFTIAER